MRFLIGFIIGLIVMTVAKVQPLEQEVQKLNITVETQWKKLRQINDQIRRDSTTHKNCFKLK